MPSVHEIPANRLVCHGRSTPGRGAAPSARRAACRRIEHVGLAHVAGEDEATADERRLGDHVGVGDPPGNRAVGLDRERLDLGLDHDVPEPRRREDREDRRRRAMTPAERAAPAVEAVGVESVLDDELPGRVQQDRGRLIVQGRREAGGPRAGRAIDPELGPAADVGVVRDERPVVDELAAGLRKGEDLGRLPGAGPAPAGSEATGIRDSQVVRGGHDLQDARLTGGSSAIGATWASASIRSVDGATGKTAFGRPAAAQTVANRPRSGSMITRRRRTWPNGGMPPMTKPVRSFASRAFARRTSGRPRTTPSRATSTRFGPDTRTTTGSRPPSSPGSTNTSDFTIWPSSALTAAAASAAVWVDCSNEVTSRVTPFRAAASITRLTAAWSGDAGTAASLLASGGHGCRDLRLGRDARRLAARDLPGERRGAPRVRPALRRGPLSRGVRARLAPHVPAPRRAARAPRRRWPALARALRVGPDARGIRWRPRRAGSALSVGPRPGPPDVRC